MASVTAHCIYQLPRINLQITTIMFLGAIYNDRYGGGQMLMFKFPDANVQVSRKEFHIYIHLDYTRVKFLSYIKK